MEETKLENPATTAGLKIDASLIAKLNLADFQNAVPLIRDLRLINDTNRAYEHVELVLTSEPPFLTSRCWRIDVLAANSIYDISDLDVKLDGGLFAGLTEAEFSKVSLTLRTADAAASAPVPPLAQHDCYLELLPRNQWAGFSQAPELVAAFVQPNDPAVDRLLKQNADVLRQNGRNSALDGYSGGSKRAWELASALWSAIANMQLDYALPPASFEKSGQKVRSPTQIESSKLGTCFDLSLLFCAALEQMGLNPLLIFTEGHAFAGVWLQPVEFSTTAVHDVTALRKRIKLQELVLFETTLTTQRPAVAFSYAIERGAQQVEDTQEAKFHLAVDIRRARLQRIKPLASLDVQPSQNTDAPTSDTIGTHLDDAPNDLPDGPPCDVDNTSQLDPKSRLLRWQHKLLDLSLRNKLLNFKTSKKSAQTGSTRPQCT